MKFLRFIIAILIFVAIFAIMALISVFYDWLRRKFNKPRIGNIEPYSLCKKMKRGDYVSINGQILCFSHITTMDETINPIKPPSSDNKTFSGDLAFDDPYSLGYIIYPTLSLKGCDFIYGKYGVKWAASNHWAEIAKEKVEEAKRK